MQTMATVAIAEGTHCWMLCISFGGMLLVSRTRSPGTSDEEKSLSLHVCGALLGHGHASQSSLRAWLTWEVSGTTCISWHCLMSMLLWRLASGCFGPALNPRQSALILGSSAQAWNNGLQNFLSDAPSLKASSSGLNSITQLDDGVVIVDSLGGSPVRTHGPAMNFFPTVFVLGPTDATRIAF